MSAPRGNEIERPARSGRTIRVPEIDRAAWFTLPFARQRILAGQQLFLNRLEAPGNGRLHG